MKLDSLLIEPGLVLSSTKLLFLFCAQLILISHINIESTQVAKDYGCPFWQTVSFNSIVQLVNWLKPSESVSKTSNTISGAFQREERSSLFMVYSTTTVLQVEALNLTP